MFNFLFGTSRLERRIADLHKALIHCHTQHTQEVEELRALVAQLEQKLVKTKRKKENNA